MQDRETAHRLPLEFALSQLRHGYQQLHEHRVSRRGMREFADGIIAPAIRRLEQALASPLSAPPQEPTGASPQAETSANVRAVTVHICDDCLNLRGEMCNEPGCRFCRRTMVEVADYLDVLLIRSPVSPVEPTPEPETCEWRITTGPLGIWVTPFCVEGSIPAPWGTERAKSCHLCGKPLRLVPSAEPK